MNYRLKFLIICFFVSLFAIAAVSASDNSTILSDGSSASGDAIKETPKVDINSSSVYTGKSIGISLKDSKNSPIASQKLVANIGGGNYSILTDNKGVASLDLNLKPNTYVLNVFFNGNDKFSPINKNFKVNVLKLSSTINPVNTSVLKYKYFSTYLKDNFGKPISNSDLKIIVNGEKYTVKTDKNGMASLKILLAPNKEYNMRIMFAGDDYYGAISKLIKLIVPATTSVEIGNDVLLSNGLLRIYLKSSTGSALSNKTLKIQIGSKNYTKTTNSEGIVIFKPNLGTANYTVSVTFEGTSTVLGCSNSKNVSGIYGNTKNPLKQKIPLKNGMPDIDYMPSNYAMADGDTCYTLLKAQYREVIQRDSYILYLTNRLSKYVFFKTKSEPTLNHIIVREKWNVIERAINTKIVKANKNNYWPSQITVSLKGNSYTYAQVRDIQNTGYTCGPTSCSMCSQFLRNYICESQFSKLAKTTYEDGSTISMLKKGLEKVNFKCSYFYKSNFQKAIDELKKGGRAIVFHTWYHYVAILDISKDGSKVLVGNPSGDYDTGSHGIPTKWVTVDFMAGKFNDYDTAGLIVKLKYSLSNDKKTQLRNIYSSMGSGWVAKNTNERIPNIGL